MVLHLGHGPSRCDQVAEAPALTAAAELVRRGAEADFETQREIAHARHLVEAGIAFEPRVVDGDFLQAQHAEVDHRAGLMQHTLDTDPLVQAAEPLHVPGDQVPRRLT